MKAELHYDGGAERIDLPDNSICGLCCDFPGGIQVQAMNLEHLDCDYFDEPELYGTVVREIERITGEGIRIRIICWNVPELRFISDILSEYPGMKYLEIRKGTTVVEIIC